MNTIVELNWKKLDPEAKWGFKAKKYTAVNYVLSIILGFFYTAIFYAALYPFHLVSKWQMIDMFFHGGAGNRSTIPYYTIFLSFWCVAFLILKSKKLKVQQQALAFQIIPDTHDFVLSPMNAQEILRRLQQNVYHAENFMVLWRVECALSNLKNIGRVADVSSFLNNLAKNDADYTESTYTLPKGLIWAIPVTGFIGTVLGLSQAIGGFGAVIAGGADLDSLNTALGGVTGGLAIAFETTLIALVAALIIQLFMTILQQKEEDFLDACTAYCNKNITMKLKMLDVREDLEEEAQLSSYSMP